MRDIPERIGNYRIRRLLGQGGMGAVYEAEHEKLGTPAAIKILVPELAQQPDAVRRFGDEAHITARLSHPGIVQVFDYGQLPNGNCYFVMELLQGETLGQRTEHGLSLVDALRFAEQIASVMAAVHDRGIVHRCLTPSNVILVKDPQVPGGERAKIIDFGIAKVSASAHASTGVFMGVPMYMAPEQIVNSSIVGSAADVYSLGIMLYQMLAGRDPFSSERFSHEPLVLLSAHLQQAPFPLEEVVPDLPKPVARLVNRMLSKDPAVRPTMGEVAAQLAERNILPTHNPEPSRPTDHPDSSLTSLNQEKDSIIATFIKFLKSLWPFTRRIKNLHLDESIEDGHRLEMILGIEIEDLNLKFIEEMINLLRKILNLKNLDIYRIESGSVVIVLRSNEDVYSVLRELFVNGQLTKALGVPIVDVQWRDEETQDRKSLGTPNETIKGLSAPSGRLPDSSILSPPTIIETAKVLSSQTRASGLGKRARVFYSYAARDERLRLQLEIHLASLQRDGIVEIWHSLRINPGMPRKAQIEQYIKNAHLILLLVSAEFVATDNCFDEEMQQALLQHESGTSRVIPILLRPLEWRSMPFSHLQILPKNERPITKWRNRDEAWLDVVSGIRQVIHERNREEKTVSERC